MSSVPLLTPADFETVSASASTVRHRFRDRWRGCDSRRRRLRLVREEARITALEARALGVQVNFRAVADVNNNARNR